jgi:hypothetical protein
VEDWKQLAVDLAAFAGTTSSPSTQRQRPVDDATVEAFARAMVAGQLDTVEYPANHTYPSLQLCMAAARKVLAGSLSEDDILAKQQGRAFFGDSPGLRGHRLGADAQGIILLLPAAAQEGDCVTVVYGSNLPVLLRPVEDQDQFRLVGQCFMHEVANGEALLGPLPKGWRVVDRPHKGRAYVNDGTQTVTVEDPRLAGLLIPLEEYRNKLEEDGFEYLYQINIPPNILRQRPAVTGVEGAWG